MKKLKVIGYPWHVSHQYELAKLPFIGEYHLVLSPFKKWDESGAPLPANVKIIPYYDPSENYDLAILHFDQQCVEWEISKGRMVRDIISLLPYELPKVIINHQTPFSDRLEVDQVINRTRELLGHIPMVVNSHEALKQWGWGNVIIHGLDASEWLDLDKEPRIISVLSKGGMEKAYRRNFIREVHELVSEAGINFIWLGEDKSWFKNKDEYKEFLGRSLVYFHGAMHSPMPRARTEAMLSGCCIVTTKYHDADTFITNGINGYLIDRDEKYTGEDNLLAQPCAELLIDLVRNRYRDVIKIGQAGKQVAIEKFNTEKFQQQWIDLINKLYPTLL